MFSNSKAYNVESWTAETASSAGKWLDDISAKTYVDSYGNSHSYSEIIGNYVGEGLNKPGNYTVVNSVARAMENANSEKSILDNLSVLDSSGKPVFDVDGCRKLELGQIYASKEVKYDPITNLVFLEEKGQKIGLNTDGSIGTITDLINRAINEKNVLDNCLSLSPLENDTILYRGVGNNFLESFGINKDSTVQEIFNSLTDNGNSSFVTSHPLSTSPVIDIPYEKEVVLAMNVKKGTAVGNLAFINMDEKETLLKSGLAFDIIDVKKDDFGKIVIYMDQK